MMRQFIAVRFKAGIGRAYTYHNDGEPVAVGDRVLIEKRGGGEQSATVAEIHEDEPPFETKPIIGKAPALEQREPQFENMKGNGDGR
jgi:ABC-type Fe3+/spermidine/putrescine transport system ATPase subunit